MGQRIALIKTSKVSPVLYAVLLTDNITNQFMAKFQGGDSPAGTQALPVGKIFETKVCRKDNPKVSQICIC